MYYSLSTIRLEPLCKLYKNNNNCMMYGRIPRYDHSGSPSDDGSHIIIIYIK
ncbi:hypothetical protein ACSBR1_024510 [Camellia fascicularis]